MKKLFHLGLAALVAAFLAMPASAGQGNHGHKGGKVKGLERTEEVQEMNKRADAQRGFTVAPGVEKAESKQAGKVSVKGGKKSHTPKGKKNN